MIRYLQIIALAATCYCANPLLAQTGPGGIGKTNGTSDLVLWLDANTIDPINGSGVRSWKDNSGFSNSATAPNRIAPRLQLNEINGYPSVNFAANTKEYLVVSDRASLKPETISIFVVGNLTHKTNKWGAFLSKTSNYNWRDGYGLTKSDNESAVLGFVGRWNLTNVKHPIEYGKNSILTLNFTGNTLDLYKNESNVETYNLSNFQTIYHNGGDLWLGRSRGTNYFLDGDIAETIILKRHVNEAERIIIHNYLSAKYNIPLVENNFYKQDQPEQGNFDHHVAGIGKTQGTNVHLDSKGTGIVRINVIKPSAISDHSFLFWGEENKNVETYNFITNTKNYSQQLNSKWRVSAFRSVGEVDVSFDIAKMNIPNELGCKGLQLVVDDNADFKSPKVYNLTVSNGVAKATHVDFADNDYFTIRYMSQIVWDGNQYYNGSRENYAPNNGSDKCLKLLVKTGEKAQLTKNAYVLEIEVEEGAILEVVDGVELSVEYKIVNNGIIDLLGEAQLIQKHEGTSQNSGSGKLKIKQQGTTNTYNYNYWSAPVNRNGFWQIKNLEQNNVQIGFTSAHNADPTSNPIKLSSRWLYTYNASETLSNGITGWIRINTETQIEPGIGYTLKGSGSASAEEEYSFSGEANSGNYLYDVTAGNDFLIGNPYPSALNAVEFIKNNIDVIDGTLYFYEQFKENNTHVWRAYQGGYATLNLLASVAADAQLGTGGHQTKGAPTNNIAVGQGFFVNIKTSGILEFYNKQRVFAKESNGGAVFYRNEVALESSNDTTDNRTKFWLHFTDPTGRAREIALGYDENASEAYDKGYDAIDYSDYPDHMLWYRPDNLLVIQGLNSFNVDDDIPLSIKISTSGTYTIKLDRTLNFPENSPIYLKDNYDNSFYNLKAENVSFNFEPGVFNNRFSIVYQTSTLSVPSLEIGPSITVKYDKNTSDLQLMGIDNLSNIKAAYIYSIEGKEVRYVKGFKDNSIGVSYISDGVYILKLEMTSGIFENFKFVKY